MTPAQQPYAARLRPHRTLVLGERVHDLAADLQMIEGVVFDHGPMEIDVQPARRLDEAVALLRVEERHARVDRAVVALDGTPLYARMLFQLPLGGIEGDPDHLIGIVTRF